MNGRIVPRADGERGVALGVTRIGVHAGPAIVGNFGGGRSSTTPPTATRSTSRRGWRRSTRCSAPASASARVAVERAGDFLAGRSAIWCCAAAASRCAPTSRCAEKPRRGELLRSGLRQAGGERPHRHRRIRRARRRETRRCAGAVSSQAAAEWRIRNSLGDVVKAPSPACGRGLG